MTLTKEMATSRDVSASRQQVSDAMADGWTYTPGTIHLGADEDGLVRWMADLNTRVVPEHPFMLLGQTTTAIRADRRRVPKAFGPIRICRGMSPTTPRPSGSPNRWITLSKNMLRGLVRE
jgi:hypothetical protein